MQSTLIEEQTIELEPDEMEADFNASSEPLTGSPLLKRIKICNSEGLSEKQTAINCGYYSNTEDGKTRASTRAFYKAVCEANGITFASGRTNRGRKVSNELTVHQNKQIVVGGAYTEQLGLEAGDILEIKIVRNSIRIKKKSTAIAENNGHDSDLDLLTDDDNEVEYGIDSNGEITTSSNIDLIDDDESDEED